MKWGIGFLDLLNSKISAKKKKFDFHKNGGFVGFHHRLPCKITDINYFFTKKTYLPLTNDVTMMMKKIFNPSFSTSEIVSNKLFPLVITSSTKMQF